MYIDFVLCKHSDSEKKYLFQAPYASGLHGGDTVIVDTFRGKQQAEVLAALSGEEDGSIANMLKEMAGINKPLRRVLYKFEKIPMSYEDPADESI